jgi:hypothetical protein
VGPRADLDAVSKRKIPGPRQESTDRNRAESIKIKFVREILVYILSDKFLEIDEVVWEIKSVDRHNLHIMHSFYAFLANNA